MYKKKNHDEIFYKRKPIRCINCGELNHINKYCKEPITSFGIIVIKDFKDSFIGNLYENNVYKCKKHINIQDTVMQNEQDDIYFLLVQRRNTIGFIDFVRGKYDNVSKCFEEMTCLERQLLATCINFETLWENLWKGNFWNKSARLYIDTFTEAKIKYEKVNIKQILKDVPCNYIDTEYGFPKGRRNPNELSKDCAIREFCEESGYGKNDIVLLDKKPINEIFIGTDNKNYKHVYYIAKLKENTINPNIDPTNVNQAGEVKNIGWFNMNQCISLFRDYDSEKKKIIKLVRKQLTPLNHKV
jgi:8-oxo-dGTP pyrophosphatase MutT (NUDIX family)